MYHLLIIEDNHALGRGISLALQSEKMNTVLRHSRKEGKKILEENPFDLIILDVNLPDGNGLELMQEIRKKVLYQLSY